MEYLLDTNIYRKLVTDLSLAEVKDLAIKIKRTEAKKNIKSGFPIVVAMELLSHLIDGDKDFDECYKALCLLVDHTKNLSSNGSKYSGTFYPPLNVILPKYFFNENGDFLKLYQQVIELSHAVTADHDVKNVEKFNSQIKIVKEQVLFEKTEIRDNYENFIKSINSGIADWEYFGKHKNERREWFKNLKSGKSTFIVSEGFMQRAFSITNRIYEKSEENAEILFKFYDEFFPALVMNELLLTQLGHGTLSLKDPEDVKWNTITDIAIMFGILYNPNSEEKILVTDDEDIKTQFLENNLKNKVLSLDEFKKLLEL